MTILPYRIETEHLVIRCWKPEDAPPRRDAVEASLADLRRWFGWAYEEPQSVEATVEWIDGCRRNFAAGTDFMYGVFSSDEREVLGAAGIHRRAGPRAVEYGGWARPEAIGKGLATEAAAALARVVLAVPEIDRIEAWIDPDNVGAIRHIRSLGYAEEARVSGRLPPLGPNGQPRDAIVFSITGDRFPDTQASVRSADIRTFDSISPAAERPGS